MGLKIKDDITDFQKSFIATIKARSKKYIGWRIEDIELDLGLNYDKNGKSYARMVLNHVLGITSDGALYDQYMSSGLNIKSIRCKPGFKVIYAMSFRYYDYMEIIKEDWESSTFRNEVNKLLFLILTLPKKDSPQKDAYFDSIILHIPSESDLEIMKKDWLSIVNMIRDERANELKGKEGEIVQTRPKSKNSKVRIKAPGGLMEVRKCFFIRTNYLQKILDNYQENEDFNDPMIAIDTYEVHENIRVNTKILRVIRDTKITTELKQKYEHRCQICGERITIIEGKKIKYYCEAHHLKPLAQIHDGPDIKENIIILCPNHHVEFDFGVIAIDPNDSQTIIHKDKENQYNGRKIETRHKIATEYLKYHFDLFIGKISRKNGSMDEFL